MSGTETESRYQNLEQMSTHQILDSINQEDRTVPEAIAQSLPQIEALVKAVTEKLKADGRLFYMGAGTSGRLGVLDASECPPTYGVAPDKVVGIIAGGDSAIRTSAEKAEDSTTQGWLDLQEYKITDKDFVVGIAASGRTPYVLSALEECTKNGIATGCVVCNSNSVIAAQADFPVEVVVGPEFVTGSTRMKAGTAQKLVLNMISTTAMIHLGLVQGNRMVNMQLTNDKLVDRGTQMVVAATGLEYELAKALLLQHGSAKKAIDAYQSNLA